MKEKFIVLSPKNEAAKLKLEYHGETWVIRGEEVPKYSRNKGVCYVCRSKDGKKILYVSKEDDKEFTLRLLG